LWLRQLELRQAEFLLARSSTGAYFVNSLDGQEVREPKAR
jgi:hypothetical protein